MKGETNFYNSDKIVKFYNCSSSSDEEDEYYRDVQLRKDIHQLERALNNVDTRFDNNHHRSRDFRNKHDRDISAPMMRHDEYHGHPSRLAVSDGLSGGSGMSNNKSKYKQVSADVL